VSDACIHAVFSVLDQDGSGMIDRNDLAKVLKMNGNGDDEKIAEIIQEVDSDGDGVISWEEFHSAMNETGNFRNKATTNVGLILDENELPDNIYNVDLDRANY